MTGTSLEFLALCFELQASLTHPRLRLCTVALDAGLNILHEDADLLVVNKPAGLVCHPTKGDAASSLIGRVRLHLGEGVRPHLINRLDRETSGVTLVAKQDPAARELRRLWETRAVQKGYLAIVHGHVAAEHGVIDAPLGRDEHSRVAIKDCVRPDGAPSKTEFWVQQRFAKQSALDTKPSAFTLLRVSPHTGRKHQIRIHLAHLGHPIVGDKIYGGDEDLYLALVENRLTTEQRSRLMLPHHALHASGVRYVWRGQETAFRATPEPWFEAFCNGQLVDSFWPGQPADAVRCNSLLPTQSRGASPMS